MGLHCADCPKPVLTGRCMRILVSGATATVRKLSVHRLGHLLGHLVTPQNGNDLRSLLRSGLSWACDNSAYSKPDYFKFWNLLIDCWEWMRYSPPDWIAVPDCVANHSETIRLFFDWMDTMQCELGEIPFPLAFVIQNGATEDSIPWDLIDAVFIGGDDEFKLRDSIPLVYAARDRGKIVHVGRVNTLNRIRFAMEIGADSIDGTGFSMFPEVKLLRALKEIKAVSSQPTLF